MDGPLTILHFNDVYNIEPQKDEPKGGAARMVQYVKSIKEENPLVLFSGDALNPSLMSIFLKGDQMIPMLNAIGVHCAVFGNHDFDFGVDHLEDFTEKTTFPWLLSNIVDKLNNEPLAKGQIKHLIDWQGTKVGLMGLVEEEWIDTLSTIDPADIIFEDFVEKGNKLAAELREEGADLVIALTHMRWPNDRKTAECIPGVDIVLGGHDHDYIVEQLNGKYIVKSGTDFRNLSKITVTKNTDGFKFDIQQVDLDSSIPEDPDTKAEVTRICADVDSKMEEHLGDMGVSMDGRFAAIRTQETNLGNFISDIILEAVPADICLMNSGTFRSDRVHGKGEFTLRDLLTILPLVDPLIVIEVTGQQLITALENGVSAFPKLEGRFPQVAGVKFTFDPSQDSGARVDSELVKVQDEYVDLNKKYRLCTKEYLASGKDGYDVFKNCPVKVSSEQCPTISTAVRNHFESVQILKNEKPCRSGHRQSLCSMVRRTMLIHKTVNTFAAPILKQRAEVQGSPRKKLRAEDPIVKSSAPDIFKAPGDFALPYENSVCVTKTEVCQAESVVTDSLSDGVRVMRTQVFSKQEELICDFRRDSLIGDQAHIEHLARITADSFMKARRGNLSHAVVRQMSIQDMEEEQQHLCPKLDGRILKIDQEARKVMLRNKVAEAIPGHSLMDEVIRESSVSSETDGL